MVSTDEPNAGEHGAREQPEAASRRSAFSRPLRTLVRVFPILVCVGCFLAVVVLRARADATDYADVNVATFALTLIALGALLVQLQFWKRIPRWIRLLPLAVAVLGGSFAACCFQIEGVDGRLVPSLRWRWSKTPDQLPTTQPVARDAERVDLATCTDLDFPQFLGPQRDLHVPHVRLDRDWQRRPPREIWRQPIGAGWSGFTVVNGFAMTMEQRGEQELVTCYEIRSGAMRWLHAITARHGTLLGGEGPRGTPTIHEGMVYAQGATGIVRCLDGRTGKAVWSIDLLQQYGVTAESDRKAVAWGRAGSPLLVDDLLIIPYGGPANGRRYSLAAFDRVTGALRWKSGDRQVSYSSPAVGTLCGQRQVVIVNEDSVSGHRPEDGAVLWSAPWPGSSTVSASASQAVIVPPDRILVSKGYGIGAALLQLVADDNGRIDVQSVWTNPKVLKTKFTNVVVQGASVFALSDGIMECVDLRTGRPRWKNRREGNFGHGQILAAGDSILVQAESGEVVLIEASTDELKTLGRVQALQDQTWNNLCLYGPYLLVRNSVEAACFELSLKGVPGGPGAL